jgi:DNA mismatch endonuclease (patch repair protein)
MIPNESETLEVRSATMRAVRSENTTPEIIVRKLLHSLGYRYRLHVRGLPGTPDIVFPSRKKSVFINGCFWHGHNCPRGARVPKSNTEYWLRKVARNRLRDIASRKKLRADGWTVLVLWECELSDEPRLLRTLTRFLTRS